MKKMKLLILSVLAAFLVVPVATSTAFAEPILTTGENEIKAETTYDNSVFIFGKEVDLNGIYEKDVYIFAGEKLTINAVISGNVYAFAKEIELSENTEIEGVFNYNYDAKINGEIQAEEVKTYSSNFSLPDFNFSGNFVFTIWAILALIVLAVLVILVAPGLFKNLNEKTKKYDFKKFLVDVLIGFAFLVLVPILALISMLTIIAIPAAIVALLVYAVVLITALVFSGYYVGKMILKKSQKSKKEMKKGEMIGAGVVGISAIQVVALIPYIGWLVEFMAFLLGLGLFVRVARK